MQEQFDSMKSSFLKKVTELSEELIQMKSQYRRQIYGLEEDHKQATYLKDIFLKQITEYQKIYNI